MATIDYKQKIKDYMNSSDVDTLYKSMLNNLFPELAESEDEKIRKEIIAILKYKYGLYPKDPKYSNAPQWIAWLDKQGEQNPWSEEDRKIIIELVGIFESAIDGGHVDIPYRLIKDYIRILKSCLPQNT